MNPKEVVKEQVEKLIQQTKESLENLKRVAIGEAWKVLQLATASVVQIIEQTADSLSGPEKKELALNLLNSFYDRVFVVVDLPFVPQLIEPIIHKYVKNILMIMVSASIDATVTIFRNTGVFIKKGSLT
jgi:ABC-type lipopolysaccharide export system ATPase subunit